MAKTKKFLAFDIGASNGRGVVGSFDGERISLDILSRFENGYVHILDHYYWNTVGLFNHIKLSLRQAGNTLKSDLASIGIDTWGVDFGLLDAQGHLLANPYIYRDPHTSGMLAEALKRMSREQIFDITGLQFMEINTLFQLLAISLSGSPVLGIARRLLLMPDLLNYWLTGEARGEMTDASTTQLLDARARNWSYPLIRAMGLPEQIFPKIIEPGTPLAPLTASVAEEAGLSRLPVIAIGSHDTASAVASVPSQQERFAYLSSGTWGLLGTELPEPLLTKKVMDYNLGNEGGVFHTVRLLRNIVNLWLLQECRRIWQLEEDVQLSWDELIGMAGASTPFLAWVDPDAPEFLLPSHMPAAVQAYCQRTGQAVPQTKGEIIRVCLESLACKYRYTLDKLADTLGYPLPVLHIVGGGTQNRLLCQMAADATQRPVESGPIEATALGNIMMQMIGTGDLSSLAEGRRLVRESFPTQTFLPENSQEWEDRYHHYLKMIGLPEISAVAG